MVAVLNRQGAPTQAIAINAALQHLSEIERVHFVLKHLEQWRLKEIADEINSNVGTVKRASG